MLYIKKYDGYDVEYFINGDKIIKIRISELCEGQIIEELVVPSSYVDAAGRTRRLRNVCKNVLEFSEKNPEARKANPIRLLIIEEGIESVGREAFVGSAVERVLWNGCPCIPEYCFFCCGNLREIRFSGVIKEIAEGSLAATQIEVLDFSETASFDIFIDPNYGDVRKIIPPFYGEIRFMT